ncbi:hypothetical protein NECAME_17550 [Necator americanus]|uniref:Uncharacterized protein n=1 Tax=Necator americanus TaxID=51031 RepID=W2TN46_NECAM|nr:hypothetical protein NECAME_17550 [Necator americanus]ETN83193.1 hypothetical protein NECAME_17550 [Necator americanus]
MRKKNCEQGWEDWWTVLGPGTNGKKKPKADKKNWIEEEFLQPGARDAKPSKPSPQEKMPEGMGAIDSTQQFPPSGIKVEKKVK